MYIVAREPRPFRSFAGFDYSEWKRFNAYDGPFHEILGLRSTRSVPKTFPFIPLSATEKSTIVHKTQVLRRHCVS
jgi:hypothetical protein